MAIAEALRRFLAERGIGPCRMVVAASGGADSTALLLACSELSYEGYRIIAGHVNHGLRGADSDEDEAFVRAISSSHDIEFQAVRVDLAPEQVRRHGVEAAARTARYAALEAIRSSRDADFVATAHTRRDQAETVLMRFLTGSGITRLQGISPATGRIIRPFLDVDRKEVLRFLSEREVVHREDRSNEDERFLRNRIRLDLMPRLLKINPNLISTLCETASQARSESAAIEELVRRSSSGWILEGTDRTTFELGLAPDDPWLLGAVLARQIRRLEPGVRDVSARDLKRLVDEMPHIRRVSVSGSLEMLGDGTTLTLRRRPAPAVSFETETVPGKSVLIPEIGKRITVERRATADGNPANAFQLPSPEASVSFTVRSRRPGDRFHPAGRSSDRSLSDFLIKRRIPREVRDSIPLLTWRGDIVSVWGAGIAEPFRVRDASQEVYVIMLEETE